MQPTAATPEGMTLRDYFAAKAVHSAMAEQVFPDRVAILCYAIADAMLAERARVKGSLLDKETK